MGESYSLSPWAVLHLLSVTLPLAPSISLSLLQTALLWMPIWPHNTWSHQTHTTLARARRKSYINFITSALWVLLDMWHLLSYLNQETDLYFFFFSLKHKTSTHYWLFYHFKLLNIHKAKHIFTISNTSSSVSTIWCPVLAMHYK